MIVERYRARDSLICAGISAKSFTTMQFDLDEESRRDIARIWVARDEEGSDAVAYLLAWSVADELHILTVATAPEARRRGLARALVKHAIEHAREAKATLLLLEAREDNLAAIALYRAEGFAIAHVRRAYYADGTNGIEMSLRLDSVTFAILPSDGDFSI